MFPRISDLINYLFGTNLNIPIQSYGFMVAMAFIAGAMVLYAELKRQEKEGLIPAQQKKILKGLPATARDLFFNAVFGFILGWKGVGIILHYSLFSLNPQEYILSWDGTIGPGLLFAAGFAGFHYYQKYIKRLDPPVVEEVTIHPYQLTGSILLIAAIFGIIGSKIFDTIEHLDDLIRNPVETLFSFAGLSFYGGLLVAAVAVIWYCRRNKIRMPYIADAMAPALILAYAIGRIGCQLSGDGCWGIPNPNPIPVWLFFLPDWVWSFTYPHNVINEGIHIPGCAGDHCFVLSSPVYPTPLYETTMGLVIFAILMSIRKRIRIPGYLFSIYLILNGIERFLIEEIRVNKSYHLFGLQLTQAQIIAIGLVIFGMLGFWYFRWVKKKEITKLKYEEI